MARECRRFAAQEKVAILRRHLLEKVAVSDLCDEFHLKPTAFYRWQKEFFENGTAAFEHGSDAPVRSLEAQVLHLQAALARKDQVIAELLDAYLALKSELDLSYRLTHNGKTTSIQSPRMPPKTPACRRQASLLFPRAVRPVHAEPVQGSADCASRNRRLCPSDARAAPAQDCGSRNRRNQRATMVQRRSQPSLFGLRVRWSLRVEGMVGDGPAGSGTRQAQPVASARIRRNRRRCSERLPPTGRGARCRPPRSRYPSDGCRRAGPCTLPSLPG